VSDSVQSQVLDKVVALLNTAGAAMTPHVAAYRTRIEAFEHAEPRAWNVLPDEGQTDPADSYSGATAHIFRFCVRCTVSSNNQADKAADPLYTAAMGALLSDPTLGGLVNFTCYLSQKWERDGSAANDNVALVLTFETKFTTSRIDPTVAMP
jgi:hypothetical protein